MNFIWKNGIFHTDEYLISVRDRALRGDGVFTTMLCADGQVVHVEEHCARILHHAKTLGIAVALGAKELRGAASEVIEKNGAKRGQFCINITITRGIAGRGLAMPDRSEPVVLIQISPAPEHSSTPPLHAIIARSVRRNEGSPLSQMKTLNYGDHILARREAEKAGADEAIMLNNAGHAACFTVGNLFIVQDGQLCTPPLSDGVMDGIIRRKWMDTADVVERSLTADDLENADAIFLTNSLRGIVPLARLNGKALGATDFCLLYTSPSPRD